MKSMMVLALLLLSFNSWSEEKIAGSTSQDEPTAPAQQPAERKNLSVQQDPTTYSIEQTREQKLKMTVRSNFELYLLAVLKLEHGPLKSAPLDRPLDRECRSNHIFWQKCFDEYGSYHQWSL